MKIKLAAVGLASVAFLTACAGTAGSATVYDGDMGISTAPTPAPSSTAAPTAAPAPTQGEPGKPGESGLTPTDAQTKRLTVSLDAALTKTLGSTEAEKVMKQVGGTALTTALMFCDVARGTGYEKAVTFLEEDAYAPDYYAEAIAVAATKPDSICPDVKPSEG